MPGLSIISGTKTQNKITFFCIYDIHFLILASDRHYTIKTYSETIFFNFKPADNIGTRIYVN